MMRKVRKKMEIKIPRYQPRKDATKDYRYIIIGAKKYNLYKHMEGAY
jgi:hypothetical protein